MQLGTEVAVLLHRLVLAFSLTRRFHLMPNQQETWSAVELNISTTEIMLLRV